MAEHYQQPGWFTCNALDHVVGGLGGLRAYLKQWSWEAAACFDGVDASASDEPLPKIAPDHPVFRLERV